MSLFDSIKAAFGGKTSVGSAPRDTSRVYLVDAEKLAESREGQNRMGPQERFHAIQTLSRFAEREKITVVAVVGGRPLREVAHGDAFNGVRVFYVEAEKTLADQIIHVLDRELRGRAVVVTNDKQLETRILERGGSTLRLTSLRRALDSNNNGENGGGGDGRNRERGERPDRGERGGGDRGERGGRDRRDRRGPRPDRRDQADRPAQPAQNNGQPEQDGAGSDAAPEEPRGNAPSSGDTIDNLIDRVN